MRVSKDVKLAVPLHDLLKKFLKKAVTFLGSAKPKMA